MIHVKKLIWDSWNVQHTARHEITQDEVESVCHGSPLVLRGKKNNRLLLIGKTDEERIIVIVLEPKKDEEYYPITAYIPDRADIVLYKRLKGEKNNDKERK
jgi:uncharacterized DUF497 family protein